MRWLFWSPTAEDWLATIHSRYDELADTKPQMTAMLEEMRQDIDLQFDENQGKWAPLRPFTVSKKQAADADPRILHETREGAGLRLRDAYAKAGRVDDDGVLTYDYPIEKPYAREHQEGTQDVNETGGPKKARRPRPEKTPRLETTDTLKKKKRKGKKKPEKTPQEIWQEKERKRWKRLNDKLDKEYFDKFD